MALFPDLPPHNGHYELFSDQTANVPPAKGAVIGGRPPVSGALGAAHRGSHSGLNLP